MMTKQEAFDRVVAHMAQQGERSMNDAGKFCVYAGPKGHACAVGCLLPVDLRIQLDTLLEAAVFNEGVWDLVKSHLALEDESEADSLRFYWHLQLAHDTSLELETVISKLTLLATTWNLDASKISTITQWS